MQCNKRATGTSAKRPRDTTVASTDKPSKTAKQNVERVPADVGTVPAAARGGTVEGGDVARINMVARADEHDMTGSIAQTEAALTLANLQPHPHPHSM